MPGLYARHPERRFNEELTIRGQAPTTQPAWENFKWAWDSLAKPLAIHSKVSAPELESVYEKLLATRPQSIEALDALATISAENQAPPDFTKAAAYTTRAMAMLDRSDTPWYPTMRLFRQPAIGDWATPMKQVTQELAQLAARHTR